jgi:hypothetical protein
MSLRNLSLRTATAALVAFSTAAPLAMPAANAATPTAKFTLHVGAPVLNDDRAFARIQDGMSENDVLGVAGTPWNKVRFENTHTTAWDYEYRDAWGYDATFSVIFNDAGLVVDRISVRRDA